MIKNPITDTSYVRARHTKPLFISKRMLYKNKKKTALGFSYPGVVLNRFGHIYHASSFISATQVQHEQRMYL